MEFKKLLVTPTVAKQYLEANVNNRRIKNAVVTRYAQDMILGRWKEDTGEIIKISKSGAVLDGQHRLMAVVKSNTPISFHFAMNVEDSVFDVLDTGSSRNATDSFKVKDIKNGNTIPSIISLHTTIITGIRTGAQKNNKPTNAILLEIYYENELFWQHVANKSHKWYLDFAKILSPSAMGGLYSVFHKSNTEKALSFMNQLATGLDVENRSINLLRQKLMTDKMSQKKMPVTIKHALIIKTWNYFILKKEVKILKYDQSKESFPSVK